MPRKLDPMNMKPVGAELDALAYFLGLCNLGNDHIASIKDGKWFIRGQFYEPMEFARVKSAIATYLGGLAETDEMYEDFMAEINDWVRICRKESRKKIASTQKDLAPILEFIATQTGA